MPVAVPLVPLTIIRTQGVGQVAVVVLQALLLLVVVLQVPWIISRTAVGAQLGDVTLMMFVERRVAVQMEVVQGAQMELAKRKGEVEVEVEAGCF